MPLNELVPHGRYITLEKHHLEPAVEEEDDHLGISSFDFGGKTEKSQVGNDLYDVYTVIKTGLISDFGYEPGHVVLVENNMVETVSINGREIHFILENYIVGRLSDEGT